MKSISLTCIIYTLKDKEVKDNVYLNIFYIWLGKVIQSGGLTSNDALNIIIDKRTLNYLKETDSPLPLLLTKLQCPYTFIEVEPPVNSLEGMMNKYIYVDYSQDVYLYCDIDILISNPFSTMIEQMTGDCIYVCAEGLLSDKNYSEGFDKLPPGELPGLSAGKFAITGKHLRNIVFEHIRAICDYSTKFYTVEQPVFNKAIYMLRDMISVNDKLLTEYVSFNGEDYNKSKTIFNDLGGEPGIGETHLNRIIQTISLYFAGLN